MQTEEGKERKLRFMMCGKWLNGAKYRLGARKSLTTPRHGTALCPSICIMRFKSS